MMGTNAQSLGTISLAAGSFILVQTVRGALFLTAGSGLVGLHIATIFANFAIILAPLLFCLFMVFGKGPRPAGLRNFLFLLAAVVALVVGTYFLNSGVPGVVLFRIGFEWKVRDALTQPVRLWAHGRLQSTNEIDRKESLRLHPTEIPKQLRDVRHGNEPKAVLVYDSNAQRWAFLIVTWREAFAEWGIIVARGEEAEVEWESEHRKLCPGVYAFYE